MGDIIGGVGDIFSSIAPVAGAAAGFMGAGSVDPYSGLYSPQNAGNFDSSFLSAFQNYNAGIPGYQAAASGMGNNPWAPGGQYNNAGNAWGNPFGDEALAGAAQAGGLYRNASDAATQGAGDIRGQYLKNSGDADALWQMAMDPQYTLRDRTQQRLTDSTRAGLSSRGLNLSGTGQGLEDQAISNFLLDWNDRQLNRGQIGQNAVNQATAQQTVGAGAADKLRTTAADDMMKYGHARYDIQENAINSQYQRYAQNAAARLQGAGAQLDPYQKEMDAALAYLGRAQGYGQLGLDNYYSGIGASQTGRSNASSGIGGALAAAPDIISSFSDFLPLLFAA